MRLHFRIFLILFAATTVSTTSISAAQSTSTLRELGQLEWENRLIIVNATNKDSTSLVNSIKAQQFEIEDRHIIWFIVSSRSQQIEVISNYPGELSSALRQEVLSMVDDERKSIVLIGKDGGIKARSNSLNLESIFGLIDTMPMRLSEMQE